MHGALGQSAGVLKATAKSFVDASTSKTAAHPLSEMSGLDTEQQAGEGHVFHLLGECAGDLQATGVVYVASGGTTLTDRQVRSGGRTAGLGAVSPSGRVGGRTALEELPGSTSSSCRTVDTSTPVLAKAGTPRSTSLLITLPFHLIGARALHSREKLSGCLQRWHSIWLCPVLLLLLRRPSGRSVCPGCLLPCLSRRSILSLREPSSCKTSRNSADVGAGAKSGGTEFVNTFWLITRRTGHTSQQTNF
ncbi:hypothetical protein EGW08_022001 [Elysia chlorotica]|uniref:Uncharacterized protein n=1 Tax=Elysia chlorotica TaxID=188477 RepID=A0A3S1AWN9_ELYCH|nr:hypothetical protein EGW08_022001 [Elysia chlorotica]